METTVKTVVTFKSSAFNMSEPREYFINPSCFGDDLAKWLAEQLRSNGHQASEVPGQEDSAGTSLLSNRASNTVL
jgi:hypothetical protein